MNVFLLGCSEMTKIAHDLAGKFKGVERGLYFNEASRGMAARAEIEQYTENRPMPFDKKIESRMKLTIELGLDELAPKRFDNGFIAVKRNGTTELLGKNNELIRRYDVAGISHSEIDNFHEGIALCSVSVDGEKWNSCLINEQGIAITPMFAEVLPISEGFYLTKSEDGTVTFYNATGEKMRDNHFGNLKYAQPFGGGMAFVRLKAGQPNFISMDGSLVGMDSRIIWASSYHENRLMVQTSGIAGFSYLNEIYQPLFLGPYLSANDFHEGVAWVTPDSDDEAKPWVLIDPFGKELCKCDLEYVDNFSCGFALAYDETESYFIDKAGKPVFPQFQIHDSAQGSLFSFVDGVASFLDAEGKTTYFDTKGHVIAIKTPDK